MWPPWFLFKATTEVCREKDTLEEIRERNEGKQRGMELVGSVSDLKVR